jgi:hypothetical protein
MTVRKYNSDEPEGRPNLILNSEKQEILTRLKRIKSSRR